MKVPVKGFIILLAILISIVTLVVLKLFRKLSIHSMIRNEQIFTISYALAGVLLFLAFLVLFIINNWG